MKSSYYRQSSSPPVAQWQRSLPRFLQESPTLDTQPAIGELLNQTAANPVRRAAQDRFLNEFRFCAGFRIYGKMASRTNSERFLEPCVDFGLRRSMRL
jgi:hypothetical protein